MLGKNNRENMCAEKHSNVGSNMLDNCMERNFLSRNESIQFFEKMKLNRSSWKWLRVSFSYIGIHPWSNVQYVTASKSVEPTEICQSADLKAFEMWNVWSGWTGLIFVGIVLRHLPHFRGEFLQTHNPNPTKQFIFFSTRNIVDWRS